MAITFEAANVESLHTTTAPVTAAPLTLAAWIQPNISTVATLCINVRQQASENSHRFSLAFGNSSTIRALTREGSTSHANTLNSFNPSNDIWIHGTAIFASASSRVAVLNGDWANLGSETTTRTPVSIDQIQIGVRGDGNNNFDGELAEVGIWNVALVQAEVEALASGVSPRLIRPSSLVFYLPMYR